MSWCLSLFIHTEAYDYIHCVCVCVRACLCVRVCIHVQCCHSTPGCQTWLLKICARQLTIKAELRKMENRVDEEQGTKEKH